MTTMRLTLAQAAEQLGVAHGTLAIQARRGKLRAEKVGPIWLTTEKAVADYRDKHLGRYGRQRPEDWAPGKGRAPGKKATRT